ncbi:MAG TPA: hypothetical protein VHD33_02995 [Legionellaceae bacterium]|nr:hypothetical protein [Legionellaceae bacterium]
MSITTRLLSDHINHYMGKIPEETIEALQELTRDEAIVAIYKRIYGQTPTQETYPDAFNFQRGYSKDLPGFSTNITESEIPAHDHINTNKTISFNKNASKKMLADNFFKPRVSSESLITNADVMPEFYKIMAV